MSKFDGVELSSLFSGNISVGLRGISKGSSLTVVVGDVGVTGRCKRILVKGFGSIGSECCRFCARLGLASVETPEVEAFSLVSEATRETG